jgi:hypothetical protein
MTDTIRTSLEWILQQLIETEVSVAIDTRPYQRSEARTAQPNGTDHGCCPPHPATSS